MKSMMHLEGKISGISLLPHGRAKYEVAETSGQGYFYFTFQGPRDQYELEDKVKITVEKTQ